MKVSWSEAAKRDLRRIAAYSVDRWGERVAEGYVERLLDRVQEISVEPETQAVFRQSYRKVVIGSHYLIYVYQPELPRVLIVRILHQSMAVGRHLPDPGEA
jgi:plasmid stabilization system protein ParE